MRAAILALLEMRPQSVTVADVTDMQCMHFKYFRRYSASERFWCSLNLALLKRLLIKCGAVVATVVLLRRWWPQNHDHS